MPKASNALDRWLLRLGLDAAGRPPVTGVLWDGHEAAPSAGASIARLSLRSRAALYRLLLDPQAQFGELYSRGELEVEGDLVAALQACAPAAARSARPRLPRLPPDPGDAARGHYDLGNDFYRLWLDEEMQYTCAYFPDPGMSLEEAQRAKMRHICRKLRLLPGESVLEAGGGWGGLALYMAREHGARVRSYNVSREQTAWARERARAEGLEGLVEFVEDDWRAASGTHDVFVSVGMLEHVGPSNYAELGRMIDARLGPRGRGLIHTIGRNRPRAVNPWIERRIFPGSRPPSLREMTAIFEPFSFSVLDVENLRLHYARTLEHWLARFEARAAEVEGRHGAVFTRAWRLYLAGSIGAFTTGAMQLFQVAFARPDLNDLPWSRAHLYRD